MRGGVEDALQRFWKSPPGEGWDPVRALSDRASGVYLALLKRAAARAKKRAVRLEVPVISVGNLVTGGAGKTPLTLFLARKLASHGPVAVLSRGYGGSQPAGAWERVPCRGDSRSLAKYFGDEPVLMARKMPEVAVWVGADRRLSGRAAVEAGARVVLLDDGFQHLKLQRDVDLVLLDASAPLGNGKLLPAGPLREPVEHLERAHALILTRARDQGVAEETRAGLRRRFPGKPVFICRHRLKELRRGEDGEAIPLEELRQGRAAAFAGIARPREFLEDLKALGVSLRAFRPFADHHFYRSGDLERLRNEFPGDVRWLITTEKDVVRLPSRPRNDVLRAPLEVDFGKDERPFLDFLHNSAGIPVT